MNSLLLACVNLKCRFCCFLLMLNQFSGDNDVDHHHIYENLIRLIPNFKSIAEFQKQKN